MELIRQLDAGDVRRFIRDWIALLSNEEYEEAESWLLKPPGRKVEELLAAYAGGKSVSDPKTLDRSGEQFEFWIYDQTDSDSRQVGGAEYFLPLDGSWSDLCATFRLESVRRSEGFGAILTNLRVP